MHVYPNKKKSKRSVQFEKYSERIDEKNNGNGQAPPSSSIKPEHNKNTENGRRKPVETSAEAEPTNGRPLSPYPKVKFLKFCL